MGHGTRARDDDAATAPLGAKLASSVARPLGYRRTMLVETDATTPTPVVASDGREARARGSSARWRAGGARGVASRARSRSSRSRCWRRGTAFEPTTASTGFEPSPRPRRRRSIVSSTTTASTRLSSPPPPPASAPLPASPSTPSSIRRPPGRVPARSTLTVTFATSELGDLLHNWVHHVRRARLAQVHVIALDRETASWCADNDVPHEDASALVDKTNLGTGVRGFRENVVSFNVIGLAKPARSRDSSTEASTSSSPTWTSCGSPTRPSISSRARRPSRTSSSPRTASSGLNPTANQSTRSVRQPTRSAPSSTPACSRYDQPREREESSNDGRRRSWPARTRV